MKTIICDSDTKFNKFYLKNLFTNELERCSEKEFDEIVTKHTAAVGCNQTKKNHPVRSCMCYNALNNGIYVPLHRELNSPASIHTKG